MMTSNNIIVYLLVLSGFYGAFISCENILTILPIPFPSHFRSFQPLLEELVKQGHNLTLISKFHLSNSFYGNYTFVDSGKHFNSTSVKKSIQHLKEKNTFSNLMLIFDYYNDGMEMILKSPEIQRIINTQDRYDLVIVEMCFVDSSFAFGPKFKAPIVALSPMNLMIFYSWTMGIPHSSSHIPNWLFPFTENMSIGSRIQNTVLNFFSVLCYEFIGVPQYQTQIKKYFHFHNSEIPDLKEIVRNISMVFVNSHYSFEYSKAESPNVINVAGIHLNPPKLMPEEIQRFMDDAEHGVIYFSLGSIIEPSFYPSLGNIIVENLKNFPQKVIMKWDRNLLSPVPSNILVAKWVSQTEILHHPNCRLFITHGGIHSLLESLNASVPLVGIPFITDQYYNMAKVEYFEIGVTLQADEVQIKLADTVTQVLSNPKYKRNIEKRSIMFRNRLAKPLDTALFWINHVLKHKNTEHLRLFSSQLPWYQLYSLDVFAIVILIILSVTCSILFLLYKAGRTFINRPKFTNTNENVTFKKISNKKNE